MAMENIKVYSVRPAQVPVYAPQTVQTQQVPVYYPGYTVTPYGGDLLGFLLFFMLFGFIIMLPILMLKFIGKVI